MTKFRLNVTGLIILIISISCTTRDDDQKVSHLINNQGELSATITIPDFQDSLKIMQITDAHLSIEDEKEADLMKYGERMHKAYLAPRKHYSQDIYKTTFEYFDDLLLKAKKEDVKLLLLTGDIVNFPSAVSVNYVYDRLVETGIPWLILAPLYNGHNPLFYSEIINGINFVGIDNSTYKINDEQVQFMEEQLSGDEPIILISHIPYSLNMNPSQPGTTALVDLISSNSDKIIAILTGHTHRISFFFTGNLCQYTSPASVKGGSLIVNIKSSAPANP